MGAAGSISIAQALVNRHEFKKVHTLPESSIMITKLTKPPSCVTIVTGMLVIVFCMYNYYTYKSILHL